MRSSASDEVLSQTVAMAVGVLMHRSFRMSEDVYQAMLARGFDHQFRTMAFTRFGVADAALSARDRGLAYGDGVFRTFPYRNSAPVLWRRHYEKLAHDCRALGIVPPGTRLPPANPGVKAWSALTDEERRVFARYYEAFAACMEAADRELGRVIGWMEGAGILRDTLPALPDYFDERQLGH